jgi:ADP-ribosyl-[dinitrogen reductase] hydrolase
VLVELAVGDAYGAGFEFRNPQYVRAFNNLRRHRRPALTIGKSGRYTDDTQMTIAVAEAMLTGRRFTPELLADHFVKTFKRDPRTGYAPRFYRFLRSVEDGAEFLERIHPTSDRSGAAMRAGPIGLLDSVDAVLEAAEIQAKVTHDTAAGVSSAQAAALMVHHFARCDGSRDELRSFVDDHVEGVWTQPWKGRVTMSGIECVRAAMTAVVTTTTLSELLQRCVSYGGDVDTVATIALAAASCSRAHDADLPERLVAGLENGTFGRDFLSRLDGQLQAFVARDA